jgi:hypothetical protein
MAEGKRIGELLLSKGQITQAQLDEALAVQARGGENRRRLGEILVARGYVKPAQIQIAVAQQKQSV